jgi:membrane protein DedA with SNARE-associated domain
MCKAISSHKWTKTLLISTRNIAELNEKNLKQADHYIQQRSPQTIFNKRYFPFVPRRQLDIDSAKIQN